jgi:deoxyribose-phosphate aldolase
MDEIRSDAVEKPALSALESYEDVARMIDFPLLAPAFPEAHISDGCDLARTYRLGSITVRPSDAQLAVKWMESSGVTVASVAGFPHGNETTATKLYAIKDLIGRGVGEIETCLNVGKMTSRQFQYVEMELMQLAEECHKAQVKLRVTIENHWLAQDLKVIGYKILKRAGADSVRAAGVFGPAPYSMEDLRFMALKFAGHAQLDAGRGAKTLDDVKALHQVGCARMVLIQPAPVLDAWKAELAERARAAAAAAISAEATGTAEINPS